MNAYRTGGPAFPYMRDVRHDQHFDNEEGMTLRQYAAIKLRVPHSGEEFIDEMIRASLRDRFAVEALQGGLSHNRPVADAEGWAKWAYKMADAMLKAREGGAV